MTINKQDKEFQFNKYSLALIASCITLLFFLVLNHEIYLPIGKNLCDFSGDGIKNIYTFAYHLKYGKGLTFSGLFYPYTEQIIYMDAQPFWIWVIKAVESTFHFHIENPVVYIHLILFLNLFLCGFFIFLILFHYCNDYYFTVIGTFIIVLLSPQIFRFAAHYALGNMSIIPMFWWWYICLSNHKKIIPHVLFSAALFLVGYIHPYLLLMIVFFFLSYEGVTIIATRKIPFLKVGFILTPLILFQISIKIFDTITDRPTRAWGAKEFACKLHDILLPLTGFIKEYFLKIIPKINTGYTEGHGYVSIFGVFVLLVLVYKFFRALFKKQWKPDLTIGSSSHWLLAAIPVLMFAFFIPFRWNMDWLINLISPLKQFRGTGRFVAVFYYAYLVFVFVFLKKLYDNYKKTMVVVLIIGCAMSMYDIVNNSNYRINDYRKYGKYDAYNHFKENSKQFFDKVGNVTDYQCIIPYPPSTEGTEVMWLEAEWSAKINYFWMSYFYNLPLATVHSSRVSFSKNMEIVQLSGFNTTPKPILEKMDKSKKCLVFVDNKHINENIPIIKNATLITSFDNLSLLSLDLNKLTNPVKNNLNPDWIDTTRYTLLGVNNFDKQPKGSFFLKDENIKNDVLTVHVPDDKKDKKLRVLFWYRPKLNENSGVPIIGAYNIKDNQEIFIHDWREVHTDTYNYTNGWFCIDYTQFINNETTTIKFKIAAKEVLIDNVAVYLEKY